MRWLRRKNKEQSDAEHDDIRKAARRVEELTKRTDRIKRDPDKVVSDFRRALGARW